MTILQRYVLREILAPTALGLVVFTFVFLVGQLFKLTDLLLNSGIPANIAGELILLLLPGVMSLTIPMALLVGILLGLGRLAADREILAIRASGVNLLHLAKPIIGFALVITGLMIWGNMKLVPYLNLKSSDLQVQILFRALSSIPTGMAYPIPAGSKDDKMSIFIDSKDEKTGEMTGVTILTQMKRNENASKARTKVADLDTTGIKDALGNGDNESAEAAAPEPKKKKKKKLTKEERLEERRQKQQRQWDKLVNAPVQEVLIVAESGNFEPHIDERVVYAKLNHGSIQLPDPEDEAAYDIITFDTLTKGIVPTFSKIEKGYYEKDPREMSLGEIREQIQIRDKGRKYSVELYNRFSVPIACIAFALFAFPLAVYVRPTGKAVAFAISFLLILFYYGLLEYGVALAHANNPMGPFAIFLPNIIIGGIGAFMLYRMVTR